MIKLSRTPTEPLYELVLKVFLVWAFSTVIYYKFLPYFHINISYNSSPLLVSVYYITWSAIAVFIFRDRFHDLMSTKQNVWSYSVLSIAGASIFMSLLYIFSLIPKSSQLLYPASDIFYATPKYFISKAFEILHQQILITVIVADFYNRFRSVKKVAIGYFLTFGLAHVLLYAFSGSFLILAITMTTGAMFSSLVFPYLIIKVRNGFLYSYMLHFAFYFVVATLFRLLPPIGYFF